MNTIAPDEHLRKALRHAPDAELAAPPELSAQILAAAHRSADEAPTPVKLPQSRWKRWQQRLWTAPAASAAFATVLMAGFIVLLWRGEVPGSATDEPVVRQAVAPKPATASVEGPALVDFAAQETQSPQAAPEAAKRTLRRVAPQQQSEEVVAPSVDTTADAAAGRPTAVPSAPTVQLAPPAAAPPPAAEVPAKAAGDSARSMRQAADAQRAESSNPVARTRPAPSRLSAAAPAPALEPSTGSAHAGDTWSWQNPGLWRNPESAWVQALMAAAEGRWAPATDNTPAAGATQLSGQRAGAALGSIWLEPEGVLWCAAASACQRAPLPAPFLRNWLASLMR